MNHLLVFLGPVADTAGAGIGLLTKILRANVVCPGFIDTGKVFADVPAPQRAAQLLELKGTDLPVQRVGQPKDAAAAYIFAMENPYVTGQVLFVDGGSSLR